MASDQPDSGILTHSESGATWEWTREGKTLTRMSGRKGKKGKPSTKSYRSEEAAISDLDKQALKKLKEGFRYLGENNSGEVQLQTFLSPKYTGFLSLDYDPARNRIAAAHSSDDDEEHCHLEILDADTGESEQCLLPEGFDLSDVRFQSPDILILQCDDRVRRVDRSSGAADSFSEAGIFPPLSFDLASGRMVYATDAAIEVVDVKTLKILLTLPLEKERFEDLPHDRSHSAALSPSGEKLAVSLEPGVILVRGIADGKETRITGDFPCVSKLEFDHSGRFLGFTEYMNAARRFRLWDLQEGTEDRRIAPPRLSPYPYKREEASVRTFDFAFHPGGKVLALRDGAWVVFVEFATGRKLHESRQRFIAREDGDSAFRMIFSPNGRKLLTRTDLGVVSVLDVSAIEGA